MKRQSGNYIIQKVAGEAYKAYMPAPLPPEPTIDLTSLYPYLEKATLALAEVNAMVKTIPNISLFLYMYVCKEALLSSQIEGTQSSFADLVLFEHDQKPDISINDVEEVSNYIKAILHGLERLHQQFPLSLRLLREMHAILLSGTRGSSKIPGEFRRSQNWIGGTRPGNALFVPPPVEYLNECLANFENFLHDNSLPSLIKAGVAHVQFETIHPFLDGNGRLGRLLIILLLCNDRMLDEPILYLSLYFKQKRQLYYELLQEVRMHGSWETWLEFFLEGVFQTAKQATQTAREINYLFDQDLEKIAGVGRIRFSCEQIFEYLKRLPQVTAPLLIKELNITAPTIRNALSLMTKLDILEEITGKKRDKVYVYRSYLNLLAQGTEPLNV